MTYINPEIGKIYEADCLELMKQFPNNYFDLIVTDPPYELNDSSPGASQISDLDKYKNEDYKKLCSGFDYEQIFGQFWRVLKKVNIFCFCSNKQLLPILSFWKDYQTTVLVWNKFNAPPFAHCVWRNDIEYIIHIREKGTIFQGD